MPVAEFYKCASRPDGLRPRCKACDSVADAEYRATHSEKLKAYRVARKDELKVYDAKRYADNREEFKAIASKWKADNPEDARINNHNRRARMLEVGGKLSSGLSGRLFKLQRGKCACCKTPLGDKYHRDHYLPLALNGPNEDWNVQLLCAPCNLQKSAKHPIDFMQQRGFLL